MQYSIAVRSGFGTYDTASPDPVSGGRLLDAFNFFVVYLVCGGVVDVLRFAEFFVAGEMHADGDGGGEAFVGSGVGHLLVDVVAVVAVVMADVVTVVAVVMVAMGSVNRRAESEHAETDEGVAEEDGGEDDYEDENYVDGFAERGTGLAVPSPGSSLDYRRDLRLFRI
ncbi:hypothetical protein K490DRAFT_53949 [Saccharata proteae CBS 121410]|uniref:Uncharacterized protein n=1 Tax=Saccharata proteae CBS 121410 TaxID=1314787 RepID=A0A9P4I0W3_9PEZI|nr:hypothetical protein K490DRAFT_53949 [Saccharata proteae CBS 121410]